MKCYYHDNREAVATCKCGKCLCRECADAHTPIMCSSCWSAYQKALRKEVEANRVLIKNNEENAKIRHIGYIKEDSWAIKKCLLLALALLIAFVLFRYFTVGFAEVETSHGTFSKIMNGTLVNLVFGSFFFMIPFGWHVLNNFLDPDTLLGFVITLPIRLIASCLVGYIAFPYYMVKLLINRIKISKARKQLA